MKVDVYDCFTTLAREKARKLWDAALKKDVESPHPDRIEEADHIAEHAGVRCYSSEGARGKVTIST